MIEISHAQFHIEYGQLGDKKLKQYATTLFKKYDSVAAETLPLSDYGIHLEIENGSIKGKGTILATVGAIYLAIGQFGDFVQGVKEISSMGKEVADRLISVAPKNLKKTSDSVYWKRGDSGTLSKLEKYSKEFALEN